MNIVPLNQLAGSGAIVVANANPLQTQLNGSYSTSKAQSTVKNSGINDSRGNAVTVVFDSELLTVRGKVFNRSVNQAFDD